MDSVNKARLETLSTKIEKFDEYVSWADKQSFVIRIKESLTIVQPRALRRLISEESKT